LNARFDEKKVEALRDNSFLVNDLHRKFDTLPPPLPVGKLPILLDAAHPELYIPDLPSYKPSVIGRECEFNEVMIVILPENLDVDAQFDARYAFPMLCPELIFAFLLLSSELIFASLLFFLLLVISFLLPPLCNE
jgi:hypothetical protein